MAKYILYFLCFLGVAQAIAQSNKAVKTNTTAPKPATTPKEIPYLKWSIKAGANLSVIYLARNINDDNNSPGICAGLNYEVNNFIRISTLYSRFRPIDIEPTWLNVNANTLEMNLEVIAHFPNKKTLFYPFVGLSYNTYKGFFTGQADYLNLKEYYPANSIVNNKWLGLNFGTGLEHNFGALGLFVDYRMRVGSQEKGIGMNIMDVCYTGGVKLRVRNGPVTKKVTRIFRAKDRYNL